MLSRLALPFSQRYIASSQRMFSVSTEVFYPTKDIRFTAGKYTVYRAKESDKAYANQFSLIRAPCVVTTWYLLYKLIFAASWVSAGQAAIIWLPIMWFYNSRNQLTNVIVNQVDLLSCGT